MQAIEFNNSTRLVEALIAAGASIHTKDFVFNTALHLAALEGREDVVRLLVERGADKTAKNADGQTPKDVATDPAVKALLA